MINSAFTLNQKPFRRGMPPSGLEKLDTDMLPEPGTENSARLRDDISCNNCRRINSVISIEPIQTRRTLSIVMRSPRALSCAGVQRAEDIALDSGNPR